MPHGSRAATIIFAVATSAAAGAIPAHGQFDPTTSGLARPDRAPVQRFQEPRRDILPSPSPWGAPSWTRTGSSPRVTTQRQAMDRLTSAGFTDVLPPIPNRDGSWTGYASFRGDKIQATIDLEGNITTTR